MSQDAIVVPSTDTNELVAVYQYIKTHRDEWDQGSWGRRNECGTAFCFAGHTVLRAGAEPIWEARYSGDGWFMDYAEYDGRDWDVELLAIRILGINFEQAEELFAMGNTLGAIRRMIRKFTGVDPELVNR